MAEGLRKDRPERENAVETEKQNRKPAIQNIHKSPVAGWECAGPIHLCTAYVCVGEWSVPINVEGTIRIPQWLREQFSASGLEKAMAPIEETE